MKKLLIVGGLPDFKHGLRFGGATVLMQNFVDFLQDQKIYHKFAQTNRYSNVKTGEKRTRLNLIYLIFKFLIYLPWCDTVMFNFSDNGVVNAFPKLLKVAKLFKKKIVLRKFGGSFEIYLNSISDEKQNKALSSISQCDLILFETKASIEHLKAKIEKPINIHWFPNVRNETSHRKDPNQFNRRLGFISHVSDIKGINIILKLAQKLSPEYNFDIYGPITDEKYKNFNWGAYGIKYHGEIDSKQVPEVLESLDFLLLPTFHREGYPGIIIEALSVGLPVISSNIGGIPEMSIDGQEGFIINPNDPDSIIEKIKSISQKNYNSLCINAFNTFKTKFNAKSTNIRIWNLIKDI